MKKTFSIVLCFLFLKTVCGQTVKFDLDSVSVTCSYHDFVNAIKKDNKTENKNAHLENLEKVRKNYSDTIKISDKEYNELFGLELDWLVKNSKVAFFDNRTNKKVVHINKIKEGKRGHVLYDTYIDSDTKQKLYSVVKRTWAF